MPDKVVAGEGLKQRAVYGVEHHIEVVFLPQTSRHHKVVTHRLAALKAAERRVLPGKVPALFAETDRRAVQRRRELSRRYAVPAIHLARQNELAILPSDKEFALGYQRIDARGERFLRFAPLAVLAIGRIQINARVGIFHNVTAAAVIGVKSIVIAVIAASALIFALDQVIQQ